MVYSDVVWLDQASEKSDDDWLIVSIYKPKRIWECHSKAKHNVPKHGVPKQTLL